MGFSAPLKGFCGAENVINKRKRGGEGSKGCFLGREKLRGQKETMALSLSESVMTGSGTTERCQFCYHVGIEWKLERLPTRTGFCVVCWQLTVK